MQARVSNIEQYRQWRQTDDDPQTLVDRLLHFQPTEAMEAGTAFHKAMELASAGSYDRLEANGYTFLLDDDAEIYLPRTRELRCYRQYGPLHVTGQVDGLEGKRVEDHKTTAYFSAERYLDGCQWRFYLDIFGADVFRWNVFEVKPVRDQPMTYTVGAPHILEARRYASLNRDCAALASGFYDFSIKHMPQHKEAA